MDPLEMPAKRRKLNAVEEMPTGEVANEEMESTESLRRPISPPMSRRRRSLTPEVETPRVRALDAKLQPPVTAAIVPILAGPGFDNAIKSLENDERKRTEKFIPSPIQLTKIRDLPTEQNVDTVALEDILGDVMIKECWNFNFLFDIDWVMSKFDTDVRSLVAVKFIHGFWRREDERRTDMMEAAERYDKVDLISAYIPDPFGTHHSKMLVLLRHDDTAQVIIHTANMIPRDWTNMTQAVWRSPLLPLMSSPPASQTDGHSYPVGSGERFKVDLFSYLNAYEKKLKGLTEQLVNYDFSTIQAAFVGSVPSRQKPAEARPMKKTSFGWLGVREILSTIPLSPTESQSAPNIVIQTSSIATLGALPTWITHLQSVLSHSSTSTPAATATASTPGFSKASTFFAKRPPTVLKTTTKPPTLNIIFPTADEIRASLDGYASGFSIHTKLQSAQQQKQLEYLRPIFCHWNHTSRSTSDPTKENSRRREACRGPAAPHIKTYIRFSDSERKSIDWAMVTSANLSKQAWGETENKKGEIWIQSWETGVIVWPELFKESGDGRERGRQRVRMVPVFGKDRPGVEDVDGDENMEGGTIEGEEKVVGFRMPYDLPLEPYGEKEIPWCATAEHRERDWKGKAWGGYHPH